MDDPDPAGTVVSVTIVPGVEQLNRNGNCYETS